MTDHTRFPHPDRVERWVHPDPHVPDVTLRFTGDQIEIKGLPGPDNVPFMRRRDSSDQELHSDDAPNDPASRGRTSPPTPVDELHALLDSIGFANADHLPEESTDPEIPVKDWIPHHTFDSADWMDRPAPTYRHRGTLMRTEQRPDDEPDETKA